MGCRNNTNKHNLGRKPKGEEFEERSGEPKAGPLSKTRGMEEYVPKKKRKEIKSLML